MAWTRVLPILLVAGLAMVSGTGAAQTPSGTTAAAEPRFEGLTADQARTLIAKLKEAQSRVRAGTASGFELLSGSGISFDMVDVPPRAAFLRVDFDKLWRIERDPKGQPLWQPYTLSYFPDGLGKLYWEVEVVLGFSGNLERVTMLYKSPAPF